MKTLMKFAPIMLALAVGLGGCAEKGSYARAVYVLVDTSGTYAKEVDKAEQLINYLLGTLNPGDSLAVARVKSRSFTEKDILAKATFSKDPMEANAQKRAFKTQMVKLREAAKGGSAYTDITGGILQASEFLNETGAGRKTILIFSDMQEELDKQTNRNVPLNLKGVTVVAVNVTKLNTDNMDPRRYMGRLEAWQKRVKDAGAAEWRMVNDLEHPERIFGS
ncbi:MAG: VWA domain-containing protein [Sulfurifustis sp.]